MSFEEMIRTTVISAVREVIRAELADAIKAGGAPAAGVYLSPAKAAEVAGVHPDTVRLWMKLGKLPKHKAGQRYRVRRDELDRFLASEPSPEFSDNSAEEIAALILNKKKAQ